MKWYESELISLRKQISQLVCRDWELKQSLYELCDSLEEQARVIDNI